MVKKIVNIVLIVGGLLAVVGSGIGFRCVIALTARSLFAMATLARIGAIMLFVGAIVYLAAVFMTAGSKNGGTIAGAVARMFFGTAAFVGQFLINRFTSENALLSAANGEFQSGSVSLKGLSDEFCNVAQYGFIIIAVSGLVLLIMGFEGAAPKKKKNTQ